ncbi:MAG: inositol 2-dehydrogenase [Thermomicrobiales bacterium]|nr:inositol 2-dehydrogenase [Thermomicrobiales bacterium]
MTVDRVSVALFGAGRIGKRHGRTLAFDIPAAELSIVCDVDETAARQLAADLRCDRWTTDPADVFSDPSIDAVVIGTSTNAHASLIAAAASAGKHAFCEKPVALDLESTDTALDAVTKAGTILQIGFQRRFDKGFAKAKQMIDSGAIGKVESIRESMRDPGPPPPGYLPTSGGLYRDMTIHCFDCLRWLAGEEVAEVFAMGSNLVDPIFGELGDIDTSVVSMRFESGALGVIDNSRRSAFGYDVRAEVFGSEGAIMIGYSRDTPLLHLSPSGVSSDHVYWFLERFDDAFVAEMHAFIRSVQSGAPPLVTGADGRAAMALAYAAEASLKSRTPISPANF